MNLRTLELEIHLCTKNSTNISCVVINIYECRCCVYADECSVGSCDNVTCQNGGSCVISGADTSTCLCSLGAIGNRCESSMYIHVSITSLLNCISVGENVLNKCYLWNSQENHVIYRPLLFVTQFLLVGWKGRRWGQSTKYQRIRLTSIGLLCNSKQARNNNNDKEEKKNKNCELQVAAVGIKWKQPTFHP